MRTGTWPRLGWPGSSPPRTRRCWRPGSVSWPPSSAPGTWPTRGTRWRRCTGCSPPIRASGCWCSTTRRTGHRWRAFLPPAGRGRVLITSQNPNWPPGQALEVPVLDRRGRRGLPGHPHRRPGPAGRRGSWPVSWAGCRWRWSRPPPTSRPRGHPGRVPGPVPAAAAGPAGPRRAHRVRQDGGDHLGAGVRPAGAVRAGRGRAAAAAGVLRARGGPAAPAAAAPARARRSSLAPRWRRCWCRCWRTRWRPMTRSRRCAGTRWSPRPGRARCRCTGWCRPSPPIRCPPSWPGSGGRPPPP